MALEHGMQLLTVDMQRGGDDGSRSRRPVDTGVALVPSEAEIMRHRLRPIDHFTLDLLELQTPLLRRQHLAGGARLHLGHGAVGDRLALFLQRFVHHRRQPIADLKDFGLPISQSSMTIGI